MYFWNYVQFVAMMSIVNCHKALSNIFWEKKEKQKTEMNWVHLAEVGVAHRVTFIV